MQNKVKQLLKQYANHNQLKLLPSGDAAVFLSFIISKKINRKAFILIPDQAGWLSYENYAKLLGFEIIKIKTNKGLIDLKHLQENAEKGSAFIYQNPAGYFAAQEIRHIYQICNKAKCLLILDATGSIADKELCNGNYADFIIASFGKWKPINLGYGGFISSKKTGFAKYNEFIKMFQTKFDYNKLYEKIKNAKKRLDFFYKTCEKVKNDLKDFEIIHRDKKGINVVVKFKSEAEKNAIIDYCEKHKYEYTLCPRYIRVMEDAVSIEVKRLEEK